MSGPTTYDFMGTARRGFRNLDTFAGRDSRPQFWLYAAAIYGIGQVGTIVFVVPSVISLLSGSDPFEDGTMFVSTVVWLLVLVALLASALCRRLHDIGRRGWWGLLPLPFLATYLTAFFSPINRTPPPQATDDAFPVVIFVSGFAYFAALALLAVLCALPSKPGPNRFGPPPLPAPTRLPPPPAPFPPPPPGPTTPS